MAEAYSDPANYSIGQHRRRSDPVSHVVHFQESGTVTLMTDMGANGPFRSGQRCCSLHTTENGSIRRSSVTRSESCRPSSTASTMSGESSVRRRTRAT